MNFSRQSIEYFKPDRIHQPDGFIDHFRYLPRPYASLAVVRHGAWEYREYRHNEPDSTGIAAVGDLLFVPMGATYDGFWHCEDGEVQMISLHFETAEIGIFGSQRSVVQTIRGADFKAAAGDPDFDYIYEFERIAEICDTTNEQPKSQERFELMRRFYRLLEVTVPCLVRRDESERDIGIEPALNYLKENYFKPCTVTELARLCSLSDSHFYLRFKRAIGVTPIEYKNRLMISNAERLLIDEPELTIEEVSERMGFSSSSYFRRIFKRMSSLSPRDFRKTGQDIL